MRSRRAIRRARAPRCTGISRASCANFSAVLTTAGTRLSSAVPLSWPRRCAARDLAAEHVGHEGTAAPTASTHARRWLARQPWYTYSRRRNSMSSCKTLDLTRFAPRRRALRVAAAALGAAALLALDAGPAAAQAPAMPKSPVTINIVDVAGDLALTQDAIEAYQKKHPQLVSKINFTKAPAPELPGKLKAMQGAGRSDIDLVLTGTDFLAAGIEQGVLMKVLPENAAKFPNLMSNYQPAAAKMQELAQDYGITVVFMPAGPLLEYNPDKVKQVPTTPAELLAWCKANPNRLIYARPANSGPGRTFIMGLPYILGDKNPKDPVNGWDKTWAYLKELNTCIEYYPTGTTAVMKELGEGSRDMTVTVTGWDINPRALGVVPKQFKVAALNGFTWINDAHYMVMPKGLPAARQAVVMELMAF